MNKFLLTAIFTMIAVGIYAQDSSRSSGVRRLGATESKTPAVGVTQRMQARFAEEPVDESELQWLRVIYRQLDLTKDGNAALYFPDEPVAGQENLFRVMLNRMASNELPAYEYLDGREVFTDDYKVKVRDVLDRFHIVYSEAKGSTERNPKFVIDEADVPASEVLTYYIIEKWEFDKRNNRMRNRVEAVCPVLHRAGDFGGEDVRYPMFWVRYDDLRPFITTQTIFTSDDNNLATCTYDDYFRLGLYDGEIYKTRNLRNKSLMQLHPDAEERAHAQDSIQRSLDTFEDKLWVPSLEELEARQADEEGTDVSSDNSGKQNKVSRSKRGTTGKPKTKPAKVKKSKSLANTSGSVTRSVRNRKK